MTIDRGAIKLAIDRAVAHDLLDVADLLERIGDANQKLREERDALKSRLAKANSQTEHFERDWYLRGDRIEQLEQERDALAATVEMMEKALRLSEKGMFVYDIRGEGIHQCTVCYVLADKGHADDCALALALKDQHDPTAILAARDARVRSEALREAAHSYYVSGASIIERRQVAVELKQMADAIEKGGA